MDHESGPELANKLAKAVEILGQCCLYQGAKWAAEALNGLDLDLDHDDGDGDGDGGDDDGYEWWSKQKLGFNQQSKFMLAKSYFDCHEYQRASSRLNGCENHNKMKFLHLYSKYIGGQLTQDQDSDILLGPLDGHAGNKSAIDWIIHRLDNGQCNDDPLLLYLYGSVMVNQKQFKVAIEALVESVNIFPYNWSAWTELMHGLQSLDALNDIIPLLPSNTCMTKIFIVYTHQQLFQQSNIQLSTLISQLQVTFPRFQFLNIQRGLLLYHGLDYIGAEKIFDHVLENDENRIDDMDSYSNILYVLQRSAKLALLATITSEVDKFRPETNCIIANYYSLKGQHEKSVVYYRRALVLNKSYQSAWTLMGHEYVELKNSHAAIESYRRATEINNKDYRAWYGLGQAYEVLDMNYYSLYYYQMATNLKPYDSRMWQALASCWVKLDSPIEAIKAFKFALLCNQQDDEDDDDDDDVSILLQIAQLYEKINDIDNAELYMTKCCDKTSSAILWLAKLAHSRNDFKRAIELSLKIVNASQIEIDEARSILMDSKSRLLLLL